jgi:hypothetical protein
MLHRDTGEKASFTSKRRIHSMENRELPIWDEAHEDHWETFAVAMELTIEGHRLIAEEIGFEAKSLWRAAMSWFRERIEMLPRRRSSPPV